MHSFTTRHRDEAMTHTVSYLRVPVPRGVAFALYHVGKHGGAIDLFSGIRTVDVIKEHNQTFGTTLKAQQTLINLHASNPANWNAANPVDRTSHCWFSDGNPAFKVNGKRIPPGGKLPWYMIGLDLADAGEVESVDEFLLEARKLGYEVVQPYRSGNERHHVVFVESPIAVLERYNVISKERG